MKTAPRRLAALFLLTGLLPAGRSAAQEVKAESVEDQAPPPALGETPLSAPEQDSSAAAPRAEPTPTGSPATPLPVTVDLSGVHLVSHPWDRYVRGFRHEHNFALTVGGSTGSWIVQNFGVLHNQTFPSAAAWSKFQYTYHLQIYKGFGYMLGSSTGYFYETASKTKAFQPVPAVMFPGVLAGLVLNISPALRFSTAFDVYMERINNITAYDAADQTQTEQISVTLVAYDLGAFLDIFYDLDWAVRLEVHDRLVYYYSPLQQPGDTTVYPADALFRQADRWYGIGLVFHLL